VKLEEILESIEQKAKDFATEKHKGQKRKFEGVPYVEHPKRVAEIVRKYKDSHKIDELISSALLHDTIEDTNTTEEDLEKLFGGLVASLVKELTSDGEEIKKKGKETYLSDKMIGMSDWALVIKLADRLDNVSDLEVADKYFRDRYIRETVFILNKLESGRKLSGTQQKLVDVIRGKIKELTKN
jgi:(p)ppGpp synthase/HD superfamily hydrolase